MQYFGVPLPIIDLIAVGIGTPPGENASRMVGAAHQPVRYAITDLAVRFPGTSAASAAARRALWLEHLERWTAAGVNFVQLREKALDAGEVWALATAGEQKLQQLQRGSPGTARVPQLLVNGRADVAAAAGAAGVHLPGSPGALLVHQVRAVYRSAGLPEPLVSVSCHSLQDLQGAREQGADLLLFGPVFEKRVNGAVVVRGVGLDALAAACAAAHPVPVLALGGVTAANIPACLRAGAAGVAAIRLFSEAGAV